MDIGNKLVLHSIPCPGNSKEKDEFLVVEIIEKRTDVPGTYNKQDKNTGFRAQTEDGRILECCWNVFDDNSMNPYSMWMETNPVKRWWDITEVYGVPRLPSCLKDVDFLKYCEIHAFEYPELKARLDEQNIPHLLLESDHGGTTAGMTTRLEAFIETL